MKNSWVAGPSPAMTNVYHLEKNVMRVPGLDPGIDPRIHATAPPFAERWTRGSSARVTVVVKATRTIPGQKNTSSPGLARGPTSVFAEEGNSWAAGRIPGSSPGTHEFCGMPWWGDSGFRLAGAP